MKTRNITQDQLNTALERVSELFDGNITMDVTTKWTRAGHPRHSVKLGVVSSKEAGGRYNPISGRHIAAACWHVFGQFLDSLGEICTEDALVELMSENRDGKNRVIHPNDHGWVDYNIGSLYYPLYYSESCHCGE